MKYLVSPFFPASNFHENKEKKKKKHKKLRDQEEKQLAEERDRKRQKEMPNVLENNQSMHSSIENVGNSGKMNLRCC